MRRLLPIALTAAALCLTACAPSPAGPGDASGASPSSASGPTAPTTAKGAAPTTDASVPTSGTTVPAAPSSTPCAFPERGVSFAGTWRGEVREDSGLTYDVTAVLTDDGCTVSGTVHYSGLECAGSWQTTSVEAYWEPGPAALVQFAETITDDPSQACAPVAQASLLRGPAGMFYDASWQNGADRHVGSGALLEPA